jgi:hypothetical protein
MSWRRGLLLVGIHLTVAIFLSVWMEWGYWPHIRSEAVRKRPVVTEQMSVEQAEEVSFYPCDEGGGWCGSTPPQSVIAGIASLPVSLLSGWHIPCTLTPTALDSTVEIRYARTRKAEVIIWTILFGGVAVLWLLAGGFPLIRPERWWLEPGAFITICTLAATLLFPIPGIGSLYKIPVLFAALTWVYWFLLLLWKPLRFLWLQAMLRRTAQAA